MFFKNVLDLKHNEKVFQTFKKFHAQPLDNKW